MRAISVVFILYCVTNYITIIKIVKESK
jgi:hypothetical protein